jgi:spermidine synthase
VTPAPNAPDASPRIGHLVVAGVSGAAVTILEFAAVRLFAPWFGQSNYVWANVIGVILLALAIGYWAGGRLADRSATAVPLYVAYVAAALYVTGVAFLGPSLASWLMPEGIDSSRILPLAFSGSLAATVIGFGPPSLVLGMTSPFLIRLDDRPGAAGRVSGRIFAVGTIGSLAGCYLAPLWLLQTIGTRATMLVSAAGLLLLAAGGFLARGRRPVATVIAVSAAVALGVAGWLAVERPPLRTHTGQLAEVESGYQTIRVVEGEHEFLSPSPVPMKGDVVRHRTRFLRHDEDAETYQSVWLPDDVDRKLLTGGRYFDHLALGTFFARPPFEGPLRVLIVGYAGGAIHRSIRDTYGRGAGGRGRPFEVLGVEIDPAVLDVAREHLDLRSLEGPGVRVIAGEDGRTVVNALPATERFDLILVDAYTRTNYVPFQVATVEFFERLARHLRPGGWIGVNVLATRGMQSPLARAVAATMDRAVGAAYVTPNYLYLGNVVIWSAPGATAAPRLSADVPDTLRNEAYTLERLTVRHVTATDGGVVLTDDLSPSDRLADEELFGS